MWTFEQHSGNLYQPDGELLATGYSGGNCGLDPEGVNNPAMQNVKKTGPIPVGYYTQGEVVLISPLGPYAIPLLPDADNEMFGRSAFYVHGDHDDTHPPQSASEGCLIFPRVIREQVYASNDRILQVVA